MRATVKPAILGHLDRLFGNKLKPIATELLHGARRAGAFMVTVRTDPDDIGVTVSDDGEGLARIRRAR